MIVNNIILVILLGLTSDVQGVMNIKRDTLQDMVQNAISNSSQNPSFQRRLARRDISDQEINTVLVPLLAKTADKALFFNRLSTFLSKKYPAESGGIDPSVSGFMGQINKAVNDPKFNANDTTSKNNIINILKQADTAYSKKKVQAPAASKSTTSGEDPGKLSLGGAGTITTKKITIEGHIKVERIKTIIIKIKSVKREDVIPQIYSLLTSEFLSGTDKQYTASLTPFINTVVDIMNNPKFQPNVREDQLRLVDAFVALGNAYDALQNANKVNVGSDGYQAADNIGKIVNKDEATSKTIAFVTKNYGNPNGGYDPAYAPFIDLLFSTIKSPDYNPNDAETKLKTKANLIQLDNVKKLAKDLKINKPRFSSFGREFLVKLTNNAIPKDKFVAELARLLKEYKNAAGGFDVSVAPKINELRATIKYKEFDLNSDEDMRNKISKAVEDIDLTWTNLTKEGQDSISAGKPEPIPLYASQELKDIVSSFDNFKSTDLPTTRSRINAYINSVLEKSGGKDPEILENVNAIKAMMDSVDFDLEDGEVALRMRKHLRKLEKEAPTEAFSYASKMVILTDSGAASDNEITNDKVHDLKTMKSLVDNMGEETKFEAMMFITSYLTHYYANQDGEFSLILYNQNDEILEFLRSDQFKEGDSQTWGKLEKLLNGMENLSSERANTGPFIKPELTNDREKNSELILKALKTVNSSNKAQALEFIEEFLQDKYGKEKGGIDFNVYTIGGHLKDFIQEPSFEEDIDKSIEMARDILKQLNQSVDIAKGVTHNSFAADNFSITGKYDADYELMAGIVINNVPGNTENVLKLFKEFCDYHYLSVENPKPELITKINDVSELLKSEGFNGRNDDNFDEFIYRLDRLEQYKSNVQETYSQNLELELLQSEAVTIPDFIGVYQADQENFYKTIRKLTKDQVEGFLPYMKKYFSDYFNGANEQISEAVRAYVDEITSLFNNKQFDPAEPLNLTRVEALLARIEEAHKNSQEAAKSNDNPFYSPNFKNNKAQNTQFLIKSLNSATEANIEDFTDVMNKYLKASYADKNGNFVGGVNDIVNQIQAFLKSKEFNPKDKAANERVKKWIYELDIVDSQIKNPGTVFGFYKYPEFGDNRKEAEAALIKSLETVNAFNKDEATGAILAFAQKFYSKNKVMDATLIPFIHKITSLIQAPTFKADNPLNKGKMEECLSELDAAYEKIKDRKSTLTPYEVPKFGDDMEKNIELLAKSIKSVNKGNQNDFESTVIAFLRERFIQVYGKEKPLTFSKAQQIIQYIQSPGFEITNQISIDQFANLLNQLLDYTNRKEADSSNLFPLEKFTYSKEYDLKQLVEIYKQFSINSDTKNFINPTAQFLSVYYADSNGVFPYQLTRSIQNIFTFVKKNLPDAKGQQFYDNLKTMIDNLDDEYYIYKYPPPNFVDFDKMVFTGDFETARINLLNAIRYVKQESLESAKSLTTRFLTSYFGQRGSSFHPSLYNLVNQVTKSLSGIIENKDNLLVFNDYLGQLKSAHDKVEASFNNVTKYTIEELKGDKDTDYRNFKNSLKLVTAENQNKAVQACDRFIMRYYGNKDDTIPAPLQSLAKDITKFITSLNFDAKSGQAIEKLDELFNLLEEASKNRINPADNPALKAFKTPELPQDYKAAEQVFVKSMEQLNHYNRAQALQFANTYFNKYYTNNGPIGLDVFPFVAAITGQIESPEFDGKSPNLKKDFEDKFKKLNAKWETIKDVKEGPEPIKPIEFTEEKSTDFAMLMKSITSVTTETKRVAWDDIQRFIQMYFKSENGPVDPRLDSVIVQIKSYIKDSNFQYPVSTRQRIALESLFSKLDNEYQKIKDPSSSGAAFKGFDPTGNWDDDKKSLISHLKFINRLNKNQAREFYLKALQANFSGPDKIINPIVYPSIQDILLFIADESFKAADASNGEKLLDLFHKLEAEYEKSLKNPDKPTFIQPKLTLNREENQAIIIEAIKTATQATRKEARAWIEQTLKKLYGTSGGELDYRFSAIYDQFISLFDNTNELNNMGKDVEQEFKGIFHKMDEIFSKLDIVEGEKPTYPSIVISGKKDEDCKNLLDNLKLVRPSNIQEARKEFSRVLDYYFKNDNGSGDFSILPKLYETLEIFNRKNFDGSSEDIRKEFETKFGELSEIYNSLDKDVKKVEPYSRIELTREFETDLSALIASFNSVNKENIQEARKFVNVFLSTYFSSSSGGFNFAVSSQVSDINLLIQADDFTFHDKDQIAKFETKMNEIYKHWNEEYSKSVSYYTTPELTQSTEEDTNRLISSMKNVDRSNNAEIIAAIEGFMKYHFSADHTKFDYRIYPTVSIVRNLISTPEFDFSSNQNQEKIRLYIIQLSNLYEQTVKNNGAPKNCNIPQLTGVKSKDLNEIPTFFTNSDSTCKKEIADYLEKFSKKYYSNSHDLIASTVVPYVSRLSMFVQSAEFDFKNKEYTAEVMRKLGEIEEAAIQASRLFKTEQKFTRPQLTNDLEESIEIYTRELGKVTKEFSASAKADVLEYAKQITMNEEGSIGIQYATTYIQLQELLNSKDFSFTDPISVSKVSDLLKKIQAIVEYSATSPENSEQYNEIELSEDIVLDFSNLLKSFESVNIKNRQDVDDFVLGRFIDWHFRIHSGEPYPSQILDIVIELKNLLSDPDFNYVTVENLEKFRKLFEKLIMAKKGIEDPESEPLPFYPPIVYGELKQDKNNLFESFSQATLFNQLEVVKFVKYFLGIHYSEKSGKFAPSVQTIVDRCMSVIGKPDFEFSKPNGAGVVKLYINEIEQEVKRLADEKAKRPYYKAPNLTSNRQINMQLLIASFKTITKETRNDAVSFVGKFLTTMYAESEGYFLPEIMKLVSDTFSIVQSKNFDFLNDEQVQKFQEALLALEAEYTKINSPEPIVPDFIEPELSGTKYLDVVRLINSFNNVNSSNKHKALNFILKYLRMYYGDKTGGAFESVEITELVQKLYTLITPDNFNFRDFESISQVQTILNELDVEINKIRDQKVDIRFETFDFTKNKAYDTQKLLISFRKFSPQYKSNAVSFLIKFLGFYYSNEGKWNDDLYNLANQLIYIVSANDFDFENPENINIIQSNLIQLDMLKKNLESKPSKLPDYLAIGLSGEFEADCDSLKYSFQSVNSRNVPDAIKMVMKFAKEYFSRKSDGKFDNRIYPLVNKLSNKVTSPSFDFTNNFEGDEVIRILKEIMKTQININKPKPEQSWIFPELTNDAENDKDALFKSIRKADAKFSKDINRAIINFLNKHYQAENNSIPKEIASIVNKVYGLIERNGFSYKNDQDLSELETLFNELADVKHKLNNPAIEAKYNKPIWKNDLQEDLATLLKSFEGMSKNNKPDILQTLADFNEKFFKAPSGLYNQEVTLRFNQISDLIQRNEFDFENSSNLQELKDLLTQVVDYYEKNVATVGPVEPQIIEPEFGTGKGSYVDKAALVNYVEEAAFAYIDNMRIWAVVNKYLLAYYGSGTGNIAKTYEATVTKLYSRVTKNNFDYTDPTCMNDFKKLLGELEKIKQDIDSKGQGNDKYIAPKMTDDVKSVKLDMLKSWTFVNKKNKLEALQFLNSFLKKFYSIKNPSGDAKLKSYRQQIYNLFGSEAFSYSEANSRSRMDSLFKDLEEAYKEITEPTVLPFEEPELTMIQDDDEKLVLSSLKYVSPQNQDAITRFLFKYFNMHYSGIDGSLSSAMEELEFQAIEIVLDSNFKADESHTASFRYILMQMDELKKQESDSYSPYDSYYNFDNDSGYHSGNSWDW